MVKSDTKSASSAHTTARKRRRTNEEKDERNMLMGLIDAAREVAAALRPHKCDVIEVALRELPNMAEDDILDGIDLLGTNPQLTQEFFGLCEVSRKKAWLWRRLKRT